MPFTITMPKLSPTMEEGTIVKWHKRVGDHVAAGDVLVEVATDKATVEYNALDEGYLRLIVVPEKGSAVVNQAIAVMTESAKESIEGYQPEGVQVEEAPKPNASTKSQPPEPVINAKPVLETASFQQPAFIPEPPLEKYAFTFPGEGERKKASPLAKKLAKEKGLDLTTVKGSGSGGRVTSRDLDLAQPDQMVHFSHPEIPTTVPGSYEEMPLTPMRKVVSQRLQQSKTFIPHFYVSQEIDAEPLVVLRDQLKEGNLKVTFNDFVIRACALALKEHPHINSGFNSVSQSIILFKTIDIAIAVTVEGGLITPIIRHADYKNIGQLSVEIKELAARARVGKLNPEEYRGGSFTISNLGMFGISQFTAVINPPQAAILAVAGIEDCVRIQNNQVTLGKKMMLNLSADHRVIDGADAAKFLKTVQKYLENPGLLLV
ncbi:MAG: pyruvate dehydrogenase complex dihydrolipoamide acetyltransferase [Chlamydiales bacterium]|nr:pyruvate dehydrogenase complex dihydrolipoamide acetyltransferase [Chlamydiales bacterium]